MNHALQCKKIQFLGKKEHLWDIGLDNEFMASTFKQKEKRFIEGKFGYRTSSKFKTLLCERSC